MQVGTVQRHGRGWRGYWREDGKRRATAVYARKGEARAALNRELDRIADPDAHRRQVRAELTLRELSERFLATREVAPKTMLKLNTCLKPVLARWGDLPAADVTSEEVERWLAGSGMKPSSRQTYVATLRQVYRWGIRADLVERNPASDVDSGRQRRREGLQPFEAWEEIERVAEECGRWAPLVIFAADCGARPGELVALQHRDVEAGKVRLPGTKTRNAQRIVHLTARGLAAYEAFPRSISTPLVWHNHGRPLRWNDWRAEVWHPALSLAELAARSPYQLRHTFAYFSLRAGVPISDVAVEMGHSSVSLTFETYGHWADEMGDRAAVLRAAWAETAAGGTIEAPPTPLRT